MDIRTAIRDGIKLMAAHGLLGKGWSLDLDNAVRRAGACHYKTKKITLSHHFVTLNEWEGSDGVKNTVLHEIAHAVAGHAAKHGPVWKAHARAIGCTAARCHAATMPERQYTYVCQNGHEIKRHRLTHRALACTKCCKTFNGGRYSDQFLFKRI
jgi:SprT protein